VIETKEENTSTETKRKLTKLQKDSILLAILVIASLLALSVVFLYPRPSAMEEVHYNLQVTNVAYSFPWLNVTFTSHENKSVTIWGYDIYYQGQYLGRKTLPFPATLDNQDSLALHLNFSAPLVTDDVVNINLLIDKNSIQEFTVTIPYTPIGMLPAG
jgi:hypothetical protein